MAVCECAFLMPTPSRSLDCHCGFMNTILLCRRCERTLNFVLCVSEMLIVDQNTHSEQMTCKHFLYYKSEV